MFKDITHTDVYYVPQCCFNLISVSKLTKANKSVISFYPKFCTMQGISIGSSRVIGKISNGLYLIGKNLSLNTLLSVQNNNNNSRNKHVLWHHGLGHAPSDTLRYLDIIKQETSNSSYSFND